MARADKAGRPSLRATLEPERLLEVLQRQEKWLEAFELAARYFPEQAPKLLEKGRVKFWAQGRHARLSPLFVLQDSPDAEGVQRLSSSTAFL